MTAIIVGLVVLLALVLVLRGGWNQTRGVRRWDD